MLEMTKDEKERVIIHKMKGNKLNKDMNRRG